MLIQTTIQQKLQLAFTPVFLEVINESANHNVPAGAESHFKVIIASSAFSNMRLLQRHRAVNAVLADELAGKIHALAMHTYTPEEWFEEKNAQAPQSPACLGGSKR